tara:strand:+ start:185 stop:436 length:252 start_codon:yes stop_codon:yes gene_type:complete
LQLFISLFFDPLLLLGFSLVVWKKSRPEYIKVFFILIIIHSVFMLFNPIKDSFFYTLFAFQILVDAVVIIGIGYLLQRQSSDT